MRIAVQLFTLRDYLKTPEDISETFKRIRNMGYRAIQLSGMGPIDDRALKALADREGLAICATHVSYDELVHHLDAVIERHRVWESRYVGLGSMPPRYRTSLEGYDAFAKEMTDIGRRLDKAGFKFIYHNHDFEFTKFEGRSGLDILFAETDPEAVDFELDVFWVQAGGGDVTEWIRKANGRMKVIHLKDMIITREGERRFGEIGEGTMNFKGILQACKEIGVEWGCVEQDRCYDKSPFECLEISYGNLMKLGAGA
ncbi:hypothetical protein PAESOLCIP111_01250 [Paenibacillus solanacearum]|uniref:Xylose isomerase-like TIM barrel domain-containing protein n=1 Tax=Paenibacillus solanacearum TaxID=2048548 RepID=A0A916NN29_9BACL|nr:sugar phosphate isomerase/epimerase [Paenibacillus solanacearum]CAG7610509.1 hypothetical protein PAESOLCIP111_01250 [Paenibacillus solanacearum]